MPDYVFCGAGGVGRDAARKLRIAGYKIPLCFADNAQYFNQAQQLGKDRQFKLNLNPSSTFTSYSQANKLESNIYNPANAGQNGARELYKNAGNNSNYLMIQGKQALDQCQSQSDPRCSTLNKYGDKDTLTQIQAYSNGVSQRYYIHVKPDPADSACSIITRKQPFNNTIASCVASSRSQINCNQTIVIKVDTHECNPTKHECDSYVGNPDCTLSREYLPKLCKAWNISYLYPCELGHDNYAWNSSCNNGSNLTPVGACFRGRSMLCTDEDLTAAGIAHSCTNWQYEQQAQYHCKVYSYSDGCVGYGK